MSRVPDFDTLKLCRDYLETVFPFHDTSCIRKQVTARKDAAHQHELAVIIPCFNEEARIARCLDSVLSQQGDFNIEIIVTDDGSTDGTPEVLASYDGKDGVHVIRQENRGFSGARNRGIAEADSDYFFFADSDDFLPDDKVLQDMLSEARSLDADILEGEIFDHNASPENSRRVKAGKAPAALAGQPLSAAYLGITAWGKLYRSEIFERIMFPEGYWYEDTIIPLMAAALSKKTMHTGRHCYVKTESSSSGAFLGNPQSLDQFYLLEIILRDSQRLRLEMTQEIYDACLVMAALNYGRTVGLGQEAVTAVFYLMCSLYDKYLDKGFSTGIRYAAPLEDSLRNMDFSGYQKSAGLFANAVMMNVF